MITTHNDGIVRRLQIGVSVGLLAGFALSPKLWLGSRLYPLTPLFGFLRPLPYPFDFAVLACLVVLLVWAVISAAPARLLAILIGLAAAYSLWDQSRWQPWFYQYLWMLAAVSISRHKSEDALGASRLILAAIYFWSGVHKFNAGFLHETFPWMLEPFPFAHGLAKLAILAPVIEVSMGAGLLFRPFRRTAVIGALAMHAFILASIGPLGHNWDNVIWPWNLTMAYMAVLLFWRADEGILPIWRRRPAFFRLVLFVFGLAPVLSLAGLLDSYLAFSLYSGNRNEATIYMSGSVADTLPERIQEQITVNESQVDELDIFNWSFEELNAPPYSEPRVFRNIGRRVCAIAGAPREMVLTIRMKATWFRRPRLLTYTCRELLHAGHGQAPPLGPSLAGRTFHSLELGVALKSGRDAQWRRQILPGGCRTGCSLQARLRSSSCRSSLCGM